MRYNINGQIYSHEFNVCSLSTDAGAIIGTGFLYMLNARLGLETREMCLNKSTEPKHAFRSGG